LAGTGGVAGFSGDGGAGTSAELSSPCGLVAATSGNLYIADEYNARVRQLAAGDTISTIAGNGTIGYTGDGSAATAAELSYPCGILVDSSGNVYFSDSGNQVVRKFSPSGSISTVAGENSLGAGYSGDGGSATTAQLNQPVGLAIDGSGNLYIADAANHRIRLVSGGNITTVAGIGSPEFSGDGGAAVSAQLNAPTGVAVDSGGNQYIADSRNHRIRKVGLDGTITTIAGTGVAGYSGDLGLATNANLNYPTGVAVDANGNIYIADRFNSRIRKVFPSGIITTIAGNGQFVYSGDGGLGTSASLCFPTAVAVDAAGNVYIADTQNDAIRLLSPVPESSLPPLITNVIGAGGFGGFQSVAPGSWIEIYGSDLAVTARAWTGADFNNVTAPTILDGTTVTIGGQPAVVSYISGGQVNALVPLGLGSGSQTLTLSSIVGTSQTFSIQVDSSQAAMFAPPSFDVGGKQYVGAILSDGSSYALPVNAVTGINSRPAHAGETIVIYGMGFGPVSPDVPYGQIAKQNNKITGTLQIFFGQIRATVSYEGLAQDAVGLYQLNVVVPSGITGDAVPLTFTLNGVTGHQTLYTAVQN